MIGTLPYNALKAYFIFVAVIVVCQLIGDSFQFTYNVGIWTFFSMSLFAPINTILLVCLKLLSIFTDILETKWVFFESILFQTLFSLLFLLRGMIPLNYLYVEHEGTLTMKWFLRDGYVLIYTYFFVLIILLFIRRIRNYTW